MSNCPLQNKRLALSALCAAGDPLSSEAVHLAQRYCANQGEAPSFKRALSLVWVTVRTNGAIMSAVR